MIKFLFIFQFLIFSALIYYFSDQPQIIEEPLFYGIDKIVHCIAFMLYGFSLHLALSRFNIKNHTLVFFIIGIIFAASDEYHQSFVQGRDADLFDWIADLIGLYLSFLVIGFLKNRNNND